MKDKIFIAVWSGRNYPGDEFNEPGFGDLSSSIDDLDPKKSFSHLYDKNDKIIVTIKSGDVLILKNGKPFNNFKYLQARG